MKKDGGPAFPQPNIKIFKDGTPWGSAGPIEYGMTLRDYFAGQAMIALMQAVTMNKEFAQYVAKINPDGNSFVAMAAYMHADAMIVQREKTNEQ